MKAIKDDLGAAFNDGGTITSGELADYFHSKDPEISSDAIRQRIVRLKQSGALIGLGKGIYTLSSKPKYKPKSDAFIAKLNRLFSKKFAGIKSCAWSSAWLNDFTIHQPAHFFYLFETEPDMIETTFNLFKDNNISAWLQPNQDTIQLYLQSQPNSVIVKPLITRSPVIKSPKTSLPELEKILVDVFAEKELFYYLRGQELVNIYERASDRYLISWQRLYSYASRRGLKKQIEKFIMNYTDLKSD